MSNFSFIILLLFIIKLFQELIFKRIKKKFAKNDAGLIPIEHLRPLQCLFEIL